MAVIVEGNNRKVPPCLGIKYGKCAGRIGTQWESGKAASRSPAEPKPSCRRCTESTGKEGTESAATKTEEHWQGGVWAGKIFPEQGGGQNNRRVGHRHCTKGTRIK